MSNDGRQDWTIPSQFELGQDYRIRIKEFAGDRLDFSDASFSIVAKPDIDIQIFDPNNAFSEVQWSAFNTAIANWEQLITSDKDSSGIFRVAVVQQSNLGASVLASAYRDNLANDRTNLTGDDVDINGTDFDNRVRWNSDVIGQLNASRLMTTMMHEIGHALGLSHEFDPESFMYPTELENQTLKEATLVSLERLGYRVDRSAVAAINAQLLATVV